MPVFCGCFGFQRFTRVAGVSSTGELPRDVGLTWKPKRECFEEGAGLLGFPHSNDSEKTMRGSCG